MSKQGSKVTDAFRASRSGAAPAGARGKAKAGAVAPTMAQQVAAPALATEQQAAEDEAFLRQFDLDTR